MADPPKDATQYILGELTRRLDEVATRLEVGMTRMDGVFVRKDIYDQWRDNLRLELDGVRKDIASAGLALKTTDDSLVKRMDAIEESRQWLYRMVGGSLAGAVISALVAAFVAIHK